MILTLSSRRGGYFFHKVVLYLNHNSKKIKNLIFILVALPLVSFSQTKAHTQLELNHIAEINLLRSNPSAYVDKVKAYISNPAVDSASRRIALEEVIPALQSTKPMLPLRVN